MQSVFLTAEWRKLIIANYAVDPAILKPFIPYQTELDFWNGKCYVSLVGFQFVHTRIKGIPIPFHINFEEINLRFYVRLKDGKTWKRGVTFIKEIVPKPALTIIANSIYNEKYVTMPTRFSMVDMAGELEVNYEWKHRRQWDLLSVTADRAPADMNAGGEEEFITEHYWGYTAVNHKRSLEYQVEHPRWQVYPIKKFQVNTRFGELYGLQFKILESAVPDSVMLAEGSKIIVRGAKRIV